MFTVFILKDDIHSIEFIKFVKQYLYVYPECKIIDAGNRNKLKYIPKNIVFSPTIVLNEYPNEIFSGNKAYEFVSEQEYILQTNFLNFLNYCNEIMKLFPQDLFLAKYLFFL